MSEPTENTEVEKMEMHPLENKWTIYEQVQFVDAVDKKEGYINSYESICTFGTVENFWVNWSKLPSVSDMFYDGVEKEIIRVDSSNDKKVEKRYKILGQAIFKEHIKPQYEDEANVNGGHLQVHFGHDAHDKLGNFWETIVLSMIGETLEDGCEITGARIVDKSVPRRRSISYRLEIWFKDFKNEEIKTQLTKRVTELIEMNGLAFTDMKIKDHQLSW